MINKFGFYNQPSQPSPAPIDPQQPSRPLATPPVVRTQVTYSKKTTFLEAESFHPFQIPPNLQLATLHRQATKFGLGQDENHEVCNCCGEGEKRSLDLGCSVADIGNVSQPLGFYFLCMKTLGAGLLVVLLVGGIFTEATTLEYCRSQECMHVYYLPFPALGEFHHMLGFILNIFAGFLLYPFLIYLTYQAQLAKDRSSNSAAAQSIIIDGVNQQKVVDKQLAKWLKDWGAQEIVWTHQVGDYIPFLEERFILQARKNLFFKRGLDDKLAEVTRQIGSLDQKLLPLKNTLNIGQERSLRTDKVIVRFPTAEARNVFVAAHRKTGLVHIWAVVTGQGEAEVGNCAVWLENVGEPQEVLWQNLEVHARYRYLVMFLGAIGSVVLLGVSLAAAVGLTHEENEKEEERDDWWSLALALMVEGVNFALYSCTGWLVDRQRQTSLTSKVSSRLIRNVLLFFFNTTLVPFSLFLSDWFNSDRQLVLKYIISLFLVSNVLSPFTSVLSPLGLYQLYLRRRMQKNGKDSLATQLQAHAAYEYFDFRLELKYELICQRILNCCFYAAVFPPAVAITIFGLMLDYWLQKWWLLNYSGLPKYSTRLTQHIHRIALFFPPIYLLGYASNLLMLGSDDEQAPYILFVLALLTILFSMMMLIFMPAMVRRYLLNHPHLVEPLQPQQHADYAQLNPTAFLHREIQGSMQLGGQRGQRFEQLQEYVMRRQCFTLQRESYRRDTCLLVRS